MLLECWFWWVGGLYWIPNQYQKTHFPILLHTSPLVTISTNQWIHCPHQSPTSPSGTASINQWICYPCPSFISLLESISTSWWILYPLSITHLTFRFGFNQLIDSLHPSITYIVFGVSYEWLVEIREKTWKRKNDTHCTHSNQLPRS